MSEYTEGFFARCWIVFKTNNPRLASKMNATEAQVMGITPSERPKKENDEDADDKTETGQGFTTV